MTVNYRALLTWFILLGFLILLVLRLDDKVTWNWFIVLIPMWLLDLAVVVYISVFMIRQCVTGNDTSGRSMTRKVWFLICIGLKVSAQVMLCIRLEYARSMASYFVAVPTWLLLLFVTGDITISVLRRVLPPSFSNTTTICCGCPPVICKSD